MEEKKNNKMRVLFLLIGFASLFVIKFLDALVNHVTLSFTGLLYLISFAVMIVSFSMKKNKEGIFAVGLFIMAVVTFMDMFDALSMSTVYIAGLEGVYAVLSVVNFLITATTGYIAYMFFTSSTKDHKKLIKLIVTIVRAVLYFFLYMMIITLETSYLGKEIVTCVLNLIFSLAMQGLLTVVLLLSDLNKVVKE